MGRLVRCKACDREISKQAKVCPQCGEKNTGSFWFAAIGLIAAIAISQSLFKSDPPPKPEKLELTSAQIAMMNELATANFSKSLIKIENSVDNYKFELFKEDRVSIISTVHIFSGLAKATVIPENVNATEDTLKKIKSIRAKISRIQKKVFPILRDKYGPAMRKDLWEDDLTAKTHGKGFGIVDFSGHHFVTNRGKKQFMEVIDDELEMLRFSQARFRWYKEQDEYTYYELNPLKDGDIAIWKDSYYSRVD